MASLRFYLDSVLKGRDTRAVFLRYKTPEGTATFYPDEPGVYVPTAKWDGKAQRVKGTGLEAQKLNNTLKALRERVEETLKQLREGYPLGYDPAPSVVRELLRVPATRATGKTSPNAGADLPTNPHQLSLPQLVRYMLVLRANELSDETCKLFAQVADRLDEYAERQKPAHAWHLARIMPSHLEEWRQWLVSSARVGLPTKGKGRAKAMGNVTANNRVGLLQACVNYFRDQDAFFRRVFTEDHLLVLGREFKTTSRVRQSLSKDELVAFYRAPLPPKSKASDALLRDIYVLGWCTSLRQSDLLGIQRVHIIWSTGENPQPIALDTTSIKTLSATKLPLNALAREIVLRWLDRDRPEIAPATVWGRHLARYRWPADNLFPFVGNRRRTVLQRLWQRMQLFSEPVEVVTLIGAKQVRTTVPRYTLLTLHTARHGFGNHMAAKNVPIEDTKLLMGHASSKTTEIYYHRPEVEAFTRAQQALDSMLND
ncbi:tyrosine-type recombinase/integrase [Hymenobacter negativus]|uniref:Tyrosine-type recombinase/integrase n=1 Tax=Hymenobacter negativus TaxID=2795026 RepID=A0ABS3QMR1_9BACT|nr:tyrosine-type recombinase/integrase [Hymenobacter negativus]MBO2012570.1 tyrosine-type recombinase/integrase [Hymenobacter negativus]